MSWYDVAELPHDSWGIEGGGTGDEERADWGEDELERRERLEALAHAAVVLTIEGDDEGALAALVPHERIEERPATLPLPGIAGPASPLSWLIVRVETFTPLPLGSSALTSLSVAVPGFRGAGRYDLQDLYRRAQDDEIECWEVFDFHLSPAATADERTWYLDAEREEPAYVEVTSTSVTFDVPMASAISSIRAAGRITWAG
jgi:hypothetical protein